MNSDSAIPGSRKIGFMDTQNNIKYIDIDAKKVIEKFFEDPTVMLCGEVFSFLRNEISIIDVYQSILKIKNREFYHDINKKTGVLMDALYSIMKRIYKYDIDNIPSDGNIIMIAGRCAARGITFQKNDCNFIFNSFIILDISKNPSDERGANEYQRIGRIFGPYKEAFTLNPPFIITTKRIIELSLANINILNKKREVSQDDNIFKFTRHFITNTEWKNNMVIAKKETVEKMNIKKSSNIPPKIKLKLKSKDIIIPENKNSVLDNEFINIINDSTSMIGKFYKHLYDVKKISRSDAITFFENIGSKNPETYVSEFFRQKDKFQKYTYTSKGFIFIKD